MCCRICSPGGASTGLTATKAHEILAALSLSDPVGQARKQVAVEHADDVAELDVKIKAMAKLASVASGSPAPRAGER